MKALALNIPNHPRKVKKSLRTPKLLHFEKNIWFRFELSTRRFSSPWEEPHFCLALITKRQELCFLTVLVKIKVYVKYFQFIVILEIIHIQNLYIWSLLKESAMDCALPPYLMDFQRIF